jgi:hypothetical protein
MAQILGIDPATIPVMFLKACIFDTFLIFGIIAFRKRRQIKAWWMKRRGDCRKTEPDRREAMPAEPASGSRRINPVQRALQDEGRRRGIDAVGALGPRDVLFDQRPLRGDRRQPFVPERDRNVRLLRQVAREGACRLGARALGCRPC